MQVLENITNNFISLPEVDIYIQDGLLVLEYKQAVKVDGDLHIQVQRGIKQITKGTAYPILVLAHPRMDAGSKPRQDGTKNDQNKCSKAMAIVCHTLAQRLVGNFYINVQKPARPTKLFTSRSDAEKWLTQFMD